MAHPQPQRAERDISTDRIVKIVDEIQRGQRPPSGEHRMEDCKLTERMNRVEDTVEEHTKQLGEGAQQFIRLEMGLANVAEKVGELISVLKWAAGIVGGFFILTCLGALVWVIVKSGGSVTGATP